MDQYSPCPPCPVCSKTRFEWMGSLALMMSIIAVLPQVWHVWKKKDARSMSYYWISISFLANIFWIIYAVDKGVNHILCTGVFFASVYIVYGCLKYYLGH